MENKKRNPFITLILGIISIGLGQTYNGQLRKGLFFMLLGWVFIAVLGLLGLYKSFIGLVSLLLVVIIYRLFVLIEAIIFSIRNKEIQLKGYNNLYTYIFYIIMTTVFSSVVYSLVVTPYLIPIKGYQIVAGSMAPTLQPGDRVMFDNKYFAANKPQIGDIAEFNYDNAPNEKFISRIIALEGDTVEYRNGVLYINDKETKENFIAKEEGQYIDFPKVKVPKGKVFMMGDNRMFSFDSRKRGAVSINNLHGKYMYTYLK